MAEHIHMIKLALKSAHQTISNDILIEIQVYQCSDIISYLLKLA